MENEYQEIDLVELAGHVLRKWWLIVILFVLSSGTAFYVTYAMITPIYSASTMIFIGKESAKIADISLMDLEVGNQLVSDYEQLLKTNLVVEQVIKELSLTATPGIVRGNLAVQIIKDSRFMRISYQDPDPEMAVQVANKLSDVLKLQAEAIVGVKNVVIVDYAKVPKAPISPNKMKNAAVAGMLGIMVALFVIFVQLMLDNTLKKETDIEKELGLPVLGAIPHFKGEQR